LAGGVGLKSKPAYIHIQTAIINISIYLILGPGLCGVDLVNFVESESVIAWWDNRQNGPKKLRSSYHRLLKVVGDPL